MVSVRESAALVRWYACPIPSTLLTPEILVLGAGPAGLACAMELSRKGKACTVVERDQQIGGLAKTLTITEGDDVFLTDIGPHRFFSKNQYLYDFIEDLLQEEWRKRAAPDPPVRRRQVLRLPGELRPGRSRTSASWKSARSASTTSGAAALRRVRQAAGDVRGLRRRQLRPHAGRVLDDQLQREDLGHSVRRDPPGLGQAAHQWDSTCGACSRRRRAR